MLPRISVFKHDGDLQELGSALYGAYERQVWALQRAKALQIRAPLPASVHLTCLLVAAIHGDVPANDMYMIRLAYSMALIRFVNEILDAGQQGRAVVPLHALARDVELPSAFVELRHAATHESLPTAYLLRDMANRALDWLHSNFWSLNSSPVSRLPTRTPTPISTPAPVASAASSSDLTSPGTVIKDLLRQWRRERRQNPDGPLASVENTIISSLKVAADTDPTEFVNVLLHRNTLVPAGSAPVTPQMTIRLWLPAIKPLGSLLATKLAHAIASELGAVEWPQLGVPGRREPVLAAWLEEICPLATPDVLDAIRTLPRPWNARALAQWAAANNDSVVRRLSEEMAAVTGAELPPMLPLSSIDTPTAGSASTGAAAAASGPAASIPTAVSRARWIKVPNWTPRPLGVI